MTQLCIELLYTEQVFLSIKIRVYIEYFQNLCIMLYI